MELTTHPIDSWEVTINPEFGCWVFSDDEWEAGIGNVITIDANLYPRYIDAVKEAKRMYKECEVISEAKSPLEQLANKFSNDQDLGREIRKIVRGEATKHIR